MSATTKHLSFERSTEGNRPVPPRPMSEFILAARQRESLIHAVEG